jgi:hypothetical protein
MFTCSSLTYSVSHLLSEHLGATRRRWLPSRYMTGELDSVFGEQAAFYLLCLSAIVLLFGLVSAYWFSRLMDTGILTFQRGW